MADTYNSNGVPHSFPGGICTIKDAAGVDIDDYVIESFTPSRPDKIIERPDQVGGDGGWVNAGPMHATAPITVQVPKADSDVPPSGSYFEGDYGFGNERWVLNSPGQKFDSGNYWTVTYEGRLDRFVPAA